MKVEQLYESLLEEGLSPVLFHTTNIIAFLRILRSNKFRLAPVTGLSREKELNKGKRFWMSTARTRINSFRIGMPTYGVLLTLDGRRFGNNFKGTAVDFFGSERTRKHDQRYEQEDRIISDKEFIDNAISYITRVDIFEEQFRPNDEQMNEIIQSLNVPVYWYKNRQDWLVGNFRNAKNLQDLK